MKIQTLKNQAILSGSLDRKYDFFNIFVSRNALIYLKYRDICQRCQWSLSVTQLPHAILIRKSTEESINKPQKAKQSAKFRHWYQK